MHILAIDPGVEKVGYSVFDKKVNGSITFKYIDSGLIKTSKKLPQNKRLEQIYEMLNKIIAKYEIGHIVMEQLFFAKNVKTAIAVAQAQGVIELLSAQIRVELSYLKPNEIKQSITGYGNADKKAVQKMLWLQLGREIKVKDDDESDAIACGMAACIINRNLV